ncbi:MAG TPA: hypothetical protein ENJ35_07820 [Gammaproteobacteria bacterium]|nr:hypothetical protein [Gammaproteobacteria bacterium]
MSLTALTVRLNGEDHIYDLHGQDFSINFDEGYYEKVRLEKRGGNLILELKYAGNIPSPNPSISSSGGNKGSQSGLTQRLYYPIPGCAGSHLHIGDRVMVSLDEGANAIRDTPDTHPSDNIIERAQPGDYLKIIGGPECNYGYLLWKVRVEKTGTVGWTPESNGREFWLIP